MPSDGAPAALADRLARHCLDLCSVPSVIGNEEDLCDLLEALLTASDKGWSIHREGNSLAARGPVRGRPLVTLFGHTDTVPPAVGGPYDVPAGTPRLPAWRDGDVLHGLGSSDMKSGLAIMLALAQALDLEALPWDLGLVFYDKEEGPYLDSGLDPLLAAVPWVKGSALGVLLEPSDDIVQLGCLGGLQAWARFEGKAAHSAKPWLGDNAVHQAAGLLSAVAAMPERKVEIGGLVFRENLNVTMVAPHGTRNVIPARFYLNLNLRFAPDRSLGQAEAWLRNFVAEASEGRAILDVTDRAPPGPVDANDPTVRHYLATTGAEVQPKLGWTDVARLSLLGIPAVNHGPGHVTQAHQAHEHTSLALLVSCYERIHGFLESPPPSGT